MRQLKHGDKKFTNVFLSAIHVKHIPYTVECLNPPQKLVKPPVESNHLIERFQVIFNKIEADKQLPEYSGPVVY